MKRLITQQVGGTDELYTPEEAIYPLFPYLRPSQLIWECAVGTGVLMAHLRNKGFWVAGSNDFFGNDALANEADVIVTNPPYSLKTKFLEHAYEIGKPFAFLLPLTALEGKRRGALYAKYGIQLIIPNRRINFMASLGKNAMWFQVAWFTWGFDLQRDLNFVELPNENSALLQT